MAKSGTSVQLLNNLEESRFLRRISDPGLKGDVMRVTGSAKDIAQYVVADMPQFTDHGERHFLNVLSYMEHLAGEGNIAKMSQLECALAIMAAYTHDLGMVFTQQEKNEMAEASGPRHEAWRTFLETHPLKPRFDRADADVTLRVRIEAQIRADFLRRSHADDSLTPQGDRITEWLGSIKETPQGNTGHMPTFCYRGFDYLQALAWLGLSHGQSIHWLQARMARGSDGFRVLETDITEHEPVAGQTINWLYLSWLLRLADVMDLDASRTPAILFEHIGIKDEISHREWLKHLALPNPPEFNSSPDGQTIRYFCGICPSPEVERAIAETIGWINDEIAKVRGAQSMHPCDRLKLQLPSGADYKVTTRTGGYLYQDVQFTLQRDAVMDLLMGEALYGEPTLALRELVQNALDALQMRKLRHELRLALRKAGKPIHHVRVDPIEAGEELKVQVTWGEETTGDRAGQRFIRVTDNGTGMDLASVRRFLTQIGRSYYKSDAYRREVEEMRAHGILCTTIAQFGIGFLSSFMLADHITVRTRAHGASAGDLPRDDESTEQQEQHLFPIRIEINSAHGLIAFYPDNERPSGAGRRPCDQCGTEVTLWLKKEFSFATWEPERTVAKLHGHFYGPEASLDERDFDPAAVDPAFEVASHIVWPRFPVELQPMAVGSPPLILDDTFHFQELLTLDGEAFAAKAAEWEMPATTADKDLHWHFCDWEDTHADVDGTDFKGTGSRIRLAIVRPGRQERPATPDDWKSLPNEIAGVLAQSLRNTFVEPQLPGLFRSPVLVAGVQVPGGLMFEALRTLHSSVGAALWLDLRGTASPRLRASRQGTTRAQSDECRQHIARLQIRWSQQWANVPVQTWRWLHHAVAGLHQRKASDHSPWSLRLTDARVSSCAIVQEETLSGTAARDTLFSRIFVRIHLSDQGLERSVSCTLNRAFGRAILVALSLAQARDKSHSDVRGNADSLAHAFARSFELAEDSVIDPNGLARDNARDRVSRLCRAINNAPLLCYKAHCEMSLLSEAFWPSLDRSFAPLAMERAEGLLGDLHLLGPLSLATAEHAASTPGLPGWLESYHLCGPLVGVPLASLRRAPAQPARGWIEERWYSSLFTLPFLFGCELGNIWRERNHEISTQLGTDHLMLFLPHPELMEKSFAEFTDGELALCASAIWDIRTGDVLYADGVHSRESLRSEGLPLEEWIEKTRLPGTSSGE
jgi:hypothetical protein